MDDDENNEEETATTTVEEIEIVAREVTLYQVITPDGCVPLEQFGEGRICKRCGAKLSRYNSDDECWHHGEDLKRQIFKAIDDAELRDRKKLDDEEANDAV